MDDEGLGMLEGNGDVGAAILVRESINVWDGARWSR
jgi:hypothetical protein